MNRNQKIQLQEIGNLSLGRWAKLTLLKFSAILSLTPLLLGGFLLVVCESRVQAQPTSEYSVVEQEVVKEIELEPDEGVQLAQSRDRFSGPRYMVYVPTYSPELLDLVQSKVGEFAYPTVYKGKEVIMVIEGNLGSARDYVRRLMREGITAEMDADPSPNSGRRVVPNRSGSLTENVRYVVYVPLRAKDNRDSLLDEISSVEPRAIPGQIGRQNVILAGEFDNLVAAQERRRELRISGFKARIYSSPIKPIIPQNSNDDENRSVSSKNYSNETNYYSVVIPTSQDELPDTEAQVREMASGFGGEKAISIQYNSNKPQIVLGPFPQLKAAQEWQRYLREYGMANVRVSNSR